MTRHLRSARADRAQYAPASEAADISRLLDPAYTKRPHSPTSPHSSTASSPLAFALPPRVYVDHDGDMHDPDYRPFPAMPSPPARKDSHSYTSYTPPVSPLPLPTSTANYRRPSWDSYPESITPSSSQDTEEEQQSTHHHGRFFKKCRSRHSPASSPPASPRGSFEEEYTYDDDDEEDDESSFPRTPNSESSAKQHVELSGKDALKYQMQALSLSVQLGVFRAKRRWRERKSSSQQT